MIEVKTRWEALKEMIDEEVAEGRGELIADKDDYHYGIKVDGYPITFFSMFQRKGAGRTMFENVPQKVFEYYHNELKPKIKGLLDNDPSFIIDACGGVN